MRPAYLSEIVGPGVLGPEFYEFWGLVPRTRILIFEFWKFRFGFWQENLLIILIVCSSRPDGTDKLPLGRYKWHGIVA